MRYSQYTPVSLQFVPFLQAYFVPENFYREGEVLTMPIPTPVALQVDIRSLSADQKFSISIDGTNRAQIQPVAWAIITRKHISTNFVWYAQVLLLHGPEETVPIVINVYTDWMRPAYPLLCTSNFCFILSAQYSMYDDSLIFCTSHPSRHKQYQPLLCHLPRGLHLLIRSSHLSGCLLSSPDGSFEDEYSLDGTGRWVAGHEGVEAGVGTVGRSRKTRIMMRWVSSLVFPPILLGIKKKERKSNKKRSKRRNRKG